jgi:hypothetical protein
MLSGAALAEAGPIKTKQEFMQTVVGKDLTILGIRVNVSPDGAIGGRAYGRQVRGSWQWQGGYFCRDLYWGKTDLGPNCQEVRLHGNKVRFTSDRGTGQYADLTIR